MDPHYRTILGFLSLIEKEFFHFGHKFYQSIEGKKSLEISPIFHQWIDTIYQLTIIFPNSFEFNDRLLILLLDELYCCYFGVFLFSSMKKRIEKNAENFISNFWTYLLDNYSEEIINRNYKMKKRPIIPDISNVRLQLWSNFYLKTKSLHVKEIEIFERSEKFDFDDESDLHNSAFRKKKKISSNSNSNVNSKRNIRKSAQNDDGNNNNNNGKSNLAAFIRSLPTNGSRLTRSLVHSSNNNNNDEKDKKKPSSPSLLRAHPKQNK